VNVDVVSRLASEYASLINIQWFCEERCKQC